MFLYKNPGLKKMLRFKLHSWGVQTLEGIIKKEKELAEKLKGEFMEKKEELKMKKEELMQKKEKIMNEMENKIS